jgi:hypothetical protein
MVEWPPSVGISMPLDLSSEHSIILTWSWIRRKRSQGSGSRRESDSHEKMGYVTGVALLSVSNHGC